MREPSAHQIEDGLAEFVGARYDPTLFSALIADVLAQQPDDAAAAMLRRGGTILCHPLGDGRAELLIAYTEDAERLAGLRAQVWREQPDHPPRRGTPERGTQLILCTFPISALSAVPRG